MSRRSRAYCSTLWRCALIHSESITELLEYGTGGTCSTVQLIIGGRINGDSENKSLSIRILDMFLFLLLVWIRNVLRRSIAYYGNYNGNHELLIRYIHMLLKFRFCKLSIMDYISVISFACQSQTFAKAKEIELYDLDL